MKKVLLGTLAVLTLAACSKDEVVQQNPNDAITFSVVTNKAVSRALNGYCNNHMPDNFQVWANVPNSPSGYKPYFSGDQFDKDGSTNNYLNNGESRYWPYSAINFFACKNATPNWNATTGSDAYKTLVVTDFTVADQVADQVDFIYAVQNVTDKPSTGQTTINFRHALSQIEFQARNENTKLYVEIEGVSVCKVNNKGTFTFPTTSTNAQIGIHNKPVDAENPDYNLDSKVTGSWESTTPSSYSTYSITTKKYDADTKTEVKEVKKIAGDGAVVSLTVTDPGTQEHNKNTMYLLPQTLTAWNPDSKATPGDVAQTGAYFLVKCKIFNVADPATGYQPSDVRIWPKADDTYADVAIPFSATWVGGKRYVYTFVFTDKGNGGFNPNPSDPSKPEDVLVPIKLVVTVDDFVDAGNTDVEMKKPVPAP